MPIRPSGRQRLRWAVEHLPRRAFPPAMTRFAICFAFALLGVAARPALGDDGPPQHFSTEVRPLLAAHCLKCHNSKEHEAEVDFSRLLDDKAAWRDRKLWRRAAAQLTAGTMPPESEKRLSKEQQDALLQWMRKAADYIDRSTSDPGPALVRRLNRVEYELTIRDLVGITFDARSAVGMPDEETAQGFTNLAVVLSMPPTLLDKYLQAADKVLDITFSPAIPNPAQKLDGGKQQQAKEAYNKLVFVKPDNDLGERAAAEQILARFLRRAYRRPVGDEELQRFLAIFAKQRVKGDGFDHALRAMLKPVLVSPHFLYRVEQIPRTKDAFQRISDHELATRLSYFLWSTMPDEELSKLADENKLHEPAVLEQQVRRMLIDAKARALTEQFAVQWLQLEKLANARPSTEFFPGFNDKLRRAMRDETLLFFDKLREEDRSVLELLDSDYAYLNQDLAKHYGIAGVTHPELRRVTLRPEDHRGGLLGMGSVLAMTSHTHRTSPTQRGKYVLDVILGAPPPPPPANVGILKEDKQRPNAETFREQLARHAAEASCANCHKKMDPLGFALDNFDASGAWRESTPERPLNTAGELPSGEKFSGVSELKRVLRQHQDDFLRNLVEQTFTYALGRTILDTDEAAVRDTQAGLAANDHKFTALMLGVVKSFPFHHRRGSTAEIIEK